jgi:glycosyltransferase involved in cell wall biosynthesis
MSVLFLAPLPEPVTGHSLACQIFLDELSKHERVEIVDLNKKEFRQGITSFGRIAQVLRLVWRIWRRRNDCDVIYFTTSESWAGNLKDLAIYLACVRRLPRMAIHLHGGAGMRRIMLGDNGWLSALMRAANKVFLRRLGGVIVLGQRHVEIFAGCVPAERIHVVANFAQDHLFVEPGVIQDKFARLQPLRVLFLSNLLPGKGHVELARAVLALPEAARARLQVDFAGGFESERDQRQFQELIARAPQLRYHGTVHGAAKQALLREAHVFCLPTYYPYEGQPISILEAYASGCAVITTDHSGIFDIFAAGVNGYAVEKQSVPDLQSALGKCLESPAEIAAMAQRNLQTASQRYRTGRYARELMDIMARIGRNAA